MCCGRESAHPRENILQRRNISCSFVFSNKGCLMTNSVYYQCGKRGDEPVFHNLPSLSRHRDVESVQWPTLDSFHSTTQKNMNNVPPLAKIFHIQVKRIRRLVPPMAGPMTHTVGGHKLSDSETPNRTALPTPCDSNGSARERKWKSVSKRAKQQLPYNGRVREEKQPRVCSRRCNGKNATTSLETSRRHQSQ